MNSFSKQKLNSSKIQPINQSQVEYLGRWVNPKLFRAFVYNKCGEETLANSWNEFNKLKESGEWFETKELAQLSSSKNSEVIVKKERGRPRNDTIRAVS